MGKKVTTTKIMPTEEYHDDEFGEPQVVVTLDDMVFTWPDTANIHYPEDLCWSRNISDVFYKGYEMGRRSFMKEMREYLKSKD